MRGASLIIDRFGRLVIPRAVRERLGLGPGTAVRLEESEAGLIIRPAREEPLVTRVNGVLVLTAPAASPLDDAVRRDRADRAAKLTAPAAQRHQ